MREECWEISRTSCLRVRVRSRNSWIGVGGTKLERISPCAKRSAIQVASLTSLLRPGTLRMCCAFARISSKSSSSRCHTGFQYTPVASHRAWARKRSERAPPRYPYAHRAPHNARTIPAYVLHNDQHEVAAGETLVIEL